MYRKTVYRQTDRQTERQTDGRTESLLEELRLKKIILKCPHPLAISNFSIKMHFLRVNIMYSILYLYMNSKQQCTEANRS